MWRVLLVISFLLAASAWANTCNEQCSSAADCNSSCPVCIGACVTCFEIQDPNTCVAQESGGDQYCQWDGIKCKPLTDLNEFPSSNWRWALFVVLLLIMGASSSRLMQRLRSK